MAAEHSAFAEFHDELRSVAGDLLAKDREVGWPVLVEAGWTGLEIPEEFGGAGAGFAETAVICEEIGRAAASTGYLGMVLAVGALQASMPGTLRDELLAGIASGEVRPVVVPGGFQLRGGKLYGTAEFVPDASGADRLLVVAAADDGAPVLVDAAGLSVTPQPVVDETRQLTTVSADGLAVTGVLDGDATRVVSALRDRGAVAIACDSLGLAQAMLDATVSYVKVRNQFGRAIGSFQAVKHACADMMVSLAVSRQLVTAAVTAVATGADAGTAASMAKAHATAGAVDIAGKAMQLHGGIGYTWESGIHVYLKRAALNRSLFGSPAAHRQKLAQRYNESRS
ncbi:MAG TPA: acyl-CoA dehydrogenase family protein [Mycobacterium sp.]|nr:acyl-CoA dehydrogenase family protein [Mycobacterium sp.]